MLYSIYHIKHFVAVGKYFFVWFSFYDYIYMTVLQLGKDIPYFYPNLKKQ